MGAKEAIEAGKTTIGIEFGSTNIKAVLIGEDFKVLASGKHGWENRLENGIWTYSLDDIYDESDHVEKRLVRMKSLEDEHEKARISADRIRCILEDFRTLYIHMSGAEKRTFYRQFISRIDVLPEADDGRIIKSVTFNFPVSLPEGGVIGDAGGERFSCVVDCTGMRKTAAESRPTYAQIKAYVLEQHGAKVSSLYIAQMKKKYGLETGKAYNRLETGHRVPKCPKEKEALILVAFRHFRMVPEQTEIITDGGEQNG